MYLEHYNLNAKPFDLSPGPQFIWLGEKHEEALATLTYGIAANLGFLLLTGEVGVGKTALVHRLMGNLDSSTIVAHITDPGLGTFDFFRLLAAEFKFANEFHSKGEFLIELERFLYQAHEEGKQVLLIVDEAQRLNNKLLDQIRVLSNIELSDQKLINIFFIGQPEFKEMLTVNSNRAIRQRIAINYHINPLTESETGQYINHRLNVAGATHDIFEPDALREIYRFAGGYPRAINIICDHALVTGYAFGLKSIGLDVIKECENEINIRTDLDFRTTDFQIPTAPPLPETPEHLADAPELSSPRLIFGTYPILIGLFVIIGVLASFYFFWPDPIDTTTPLPPSQVAESSADQTETGTDDQWGLSENVVKEQPEDTSASEKALALSDAQNDTQDSTAPGNLTPSVQSTPDMPADEDQTASVDSSPDMPADEDETASAAPSPDVAAGEDEIAFAETSPDMPAESESPAPDRLSDNDAADSGADPFAKSKNALAVLTAPPDIELEIKPDGATGDAQLESPADPPAPAPDRSFDQNGSSNNNTADSGVDGTAKSDGATPSAPADAQPATQPETSTQNQTATIDPQTAAVDDQAAAASAPPPDTSAPDKSPSGSTPPGNTEADVAAQPAPSDAKPESQADSGKLAGAAGGAAAIGVLAGNNTKSPDVDRPQGGAKTASPTTSSQKSSAGTTSADQQPATQPPQPQARSPETPSEPSVTANAQTQLQTAAAPLDSDQSPNDQEGSNALENRLLLFLQNYCNTYAAKDLDAFTDLFIPDARENGQPFVRLLPKYERNFNFIESIEYRIELQQYSYDDDNAIVDMNGRFFLRWLPPDSEWRENSGTITMRLREKGNSFLVQRLDYQGGGSKKE